MNSVVNPGTFFADVSHAITKEFDLPPECPVRGCKRNQELITIKHNYLIPMAILRDRIALELTKPPSKRKYMRAMPPAMEEYAKKAIAALLNMSPHDHA
jgi:hypothetical protein